MKRCSFTLVNREMKINANSVISLYTLQNGLNGTIQIPQKNHMRVRNIRYHPYLAQNILIYRYLISIFNISNIQRCHASIIHFLFLTYQFLGMITFSPISASDCQRILVLQFASAFHFIFRYRLFNLRLLLTTYVSSTESPFT